ncbi:MAG: hypothetical protein RLZZ490_2152, partial [Cyanobacteriota bacterium]
MVTHLDFPKCPFPYPMLYPQVAKDGARGGSGHSNFQ